MVSNQPRATVTVPDGVDIDPYIAQLKNGDILSLAVNGTYTLGGAVNGMVGLPNGYANQWTTVEGNNATITEGATGIYLTNKHYIKFKNLNLTHQTTIDAWFIGCSHIDADNLDIVNDNGTAALDATRFDECSDFTWANCAVHDCDVNHASFDGFEIFNNCQDMTFINCEVDTIVGHIAPEHHGFEVYAEAAAAGGVASENIRFNGCSASVVDTGFSCDGGPDSLAHVDVICDGCSGFNNTDYGYEGINGATLRRHVGAGINTGNGTAETFGNVTDY